MLREPGRVPVLGGRGLRFEGPLRERDVLCELGRSSVHRFERLRDARALHRGGLLRERIGLALLRSERLRSGILLRPRHLQLEEDDVRARGPNLRPLGGSRDFRRNFSGKQAESLGTRLAQA